MDLIQTKLCGHCKTPQPTSEFYKDISKKDGLCSLCKSCHNIFSRLYCKTPKRKVYMKQYRKKHRYDERIVEQNKYYRIKAKYGLSKQDYQNLLDEKGHCEICFRSFLERKPTIDHDHCEGEVRGVLCGKCNAALGFAKDNIMILESAIKYLEKYRSPNPK